MTDLFMLTKPPGSTRAKLCLELVKRSRDPVLYLFCDGVFHLVGKQESAKSQDCDLQRRCPDTGGADRR